MRILGSALIAILVVSKFPFAAALETSSPPKVESKSEKPYTSKAGHPLFLSPQSDPIAIHSGFAFVTNTLADTLDVIDVASQEIVKRVSVGINPVSVAIKPDGSEAWVSNHISDSVSVIDLNAKSPTCFQVIATIQDLDPETHATRFDEPVGVAFASDNKAYVALSSENKIAVINTSTRAVDKYLKITAQDPRAIVVRNGRLFVLPFESNNQTQLSGGLNDEFDGDLVTFNAKNHSIDNNNVLSTGHVVDIIKHPRIPDRDLFIFDVATDELTSTVDTLGTLLYGLTVDSLGHVYISQTDARNDVNGRAGSKKHGLAELGNRAFLNRITKVAFDSDQLGQVSFLDLEPMPPQDPMEGKALATPFAIKISDDDETLFATAAGSDMLFAMDAATGEIISRAAVGAVPQGLAIETSSQGEPKRVWVLNAADNTVSIINVGDLRHIKNEHTILLEDPTPPEVKRGRIAFSTASSSTTGTFSCASCHPDGHTDQLLWVLKTPIVTGGDQIMPRVTMPVRGLRDTAPFHWDGIPGDPYGGINSASIHAAVDANSDLSRPESATRHLIDGGIAGTMSRVGDESVNDEGKPGRLTGQQREDMAKFLLAVPYPPAQRRAYTNELSKAAVRGFELFHVEGDHNPKMPEPNRCGDCHRMPFLVSTNTPGTGMDTPTFRGAYDRWLILPQGRLNIIDFDFFETLTRDGIPERGLWRHSWAQRKRFDPVWDMVLEASTGFPGAYARQVTLNSQTADLGVTNHLLNALESAALDASIRLQVDGVFVGEGTAEQVSMLFSADSSNQAYRDPSERKYSRGDLIALASKGGFVGTFTGRLGNNVDYHHPQPAIWTHGPIEQQRGKQEFPVLFGDMLTMKFSGRHIQDKPVLFVDGHRVDGSIQVDQETVTVQLSHSPSVGTHFLQIQNADGLVSNELIFHVVNEASLRFNSKELSLGQRLQASQWDRIIGSWKDLATDGNEISLTYAWKINNQVVEVLSQQPGSQSVSLILVDSESGKVIQVGGDVQGNSFNGVFEVTDHGDAILNAELFGRSGNRVELRLKYRFEDNNTLIIEREGSEPFSVRLKRTHN